MEDLILKCNSGDGTELKVKPLKIKKQSVIAFYSTSDETVIVDLTHSQTSELIEHLTNCLKEVWKGCANIPMTEEPKCIDIKNPPTWVITYDGSGLPLKEITETNLIFENDLQVTIELDRIYIEFLKGMRDRGCKLGLHEKF